MCNGWTLIACFGDMSGVLVAVGRTRWWCACVCVTHLYALTFFLLVGNRAKDAKMSSNMRSLCFSYLEKIYRIHTHAHTSIHTMRTLN